MACQPLHVPCRVHARLARLGGGLTCALQHPRAAPRPHCRYCNGADLGAPTQNPACFCPRLRGQGLNGIVKHSDLTAAGISCTEYCK